MDQNILFLCTGNSARSQMGEALLRARSGGYFQVFSAGTEPKDEIFPPVVAVMREVGIDLASRKPKQVGEYLGKLHFYRVIVVCGDAEERCPAIFGAAARLFWPFDDPARQAGSPDEVLAACRRIRDQIDQRVCEWLVEMGVPVRPLPASPQA